MTTKPTKPKPRRRWLQFSLRKLLLLVTVLCVLFAWVGWLTHRADEQRKVVEWVREMGGTVSYDYEFDKDGAFIADAEPPGPKWLRDFLGAEFFQDVLAVYLYHTPVSDLTPLAKLTRLQSLWLNNTPVSDLTPLAKLTSLQSLGLQSTQVSDLTPVAKLTSLDWLGLRNTQVSDEQGEELRKALPNCYIAWWPSSDQSP